MLPADELRLWLGFICDGGASVLFFLSGFIDCNLLCACLAKKVRCKYDKQK